MEIYFNMGKLVFDVLPVCEQFELCILLLFSSWKISQKFCVFSFLRATYCFESKAVNECIDIENE